jgi:hypothetical protein
MLLFCEESKAAARASDKVVTKDRGGSRQERKDEMTKGREKSDDCMVPEGRRKAVPNALKQGGKAVTASESEGLYELCWLAVLRLARYDGDVACASV